jgi:hypothetical protein
MKSSMTKIRSAPTATTNIAISQKFTVGKRGSVLIATSPWVRDMMAISGGEAT